MATNEETISAVLAKWHEIASKEPTREQTAQFVKDELSGKMSEEDIADEARGTKRLREMMAWQAALAPERKRELREDAVRVQEERRAEAVEFCEFLEKLASDQRKYLERCRPARERHRDGNRPSSGR
ncbi:hypothetical protein [Streptomyces sp. V3I8]|uniref:hypothetical protein n=1 Tax=Streptomyces sp. V3I8 TaxID=3042279 RepID=UPI0027D77A27|nr:hypothetical protein [Streptomyces sp. V3I8]